MSASIYYNYPFHLFSTFLSTGDTIVGEKKEKEKERKVLIFMKLTFRWGESNKWEVCLLIGLIEGEKKAEKNHSAREWGLGRGHNFKYSNSLSGKVTCEQRLWRRWGRKPWGHLRKKNSSIGNTYDKGPKVGAGQCSRDRKEAGVAGTKAGSGKMSQKVREARR